jgi:hypothetical protein
MTLEVQHIPELLHNLRTRRSVLATAGAGVAAAVTGISAHAQSPEAGTPASSSATPTAAAAYETMPQIFGADFNFDFLVLLGYTYERAADIGECFAAASKIEDGNFESWVTAFLALADRLNGIGETAEAAGHTVSASEAFLRACSYYASAQWPSLGTSNPDQISEIWTKHKDAFEAFLRNASFPSEKLDIPYLPDLPIPAYAPLGDPDQRQ